MKSAKHILASVLVCVMALCVFTACGGGGSSKTAGTVIVSTLAEAGITATETEALDKGTEAYAAAWESASLTYAEYVQNAVENGTDYDTAASAAWQTMYSKIKAYWPDDADVVYRYTIGSDETTNDVAKKVAESLIADKAEGKTVKEIGYATAIDYDCDETTNEITQVRKLFVFCIYE